MPEISILTSPVSATIGIITIVISLLCFKRPELTQKLLFSPYDCWHNHHWYRLLTSGFIHNDFAHLFFNMLTFYFFAFDLERIIGSTSFFILYIGSLLLSHIPTFRKHRNDYYYRSLGASGAISGVIFGMILLIPSSTLMIMPIPFPIPAAVCGVLYLIWCRFASRLSRDNINHDAHFAGSIVGIIITFLMFPNEVLTAWHTLFFVTK
jgi:membrane associated rhomboid family serine protease